MALTVELLDAAHMRFPVHSWSQERRPSADRVKLDNAILQQNAADVKHGTLPRDILRARPPGGRVGLAHVDRAEGITVFPLALRVSMFSRRHSSCSRSSSRAFKLQSLPPCMYIMSETAFLQASQAPQFESPMRTHDPNSMCSLKHQ